MYTICPLSRSVFSLTNFFTNALEVMGFLARYFLTSSTVILEGDSNLGFLAGGELTVACCCSSFVVGTFEGPGAI